jgi:hypothetical protein
MVPARRLPRGVDHPSTVDPEREVSPNRQRRADAVGLLDRQILHPEEAERRLDGLLRRGCYAHVLPQLPTP